jgi:hypothetical protein
MKHNVLISNESLSLNEFVDQNQCEGDKYTLFVCLRIVVSNTCVVLLFFFFLCTLCYQFLWIVHFWLPLRYSLMFIYDTKDMMWTFVDVYGYEYALALNITFYYFNTRARDSLR